MASNISLNPTKDRSWFFGFGNMLYKQNHQWWGTRSWVIQFLVWTALINGMLLYFILDLGMHADNASLKAAVANEGL